ncbi:hypothetical protein Pelo_4866 [Pelomyxa schiedti]|nr:hypothetical protein Pelo_4866 [Pelomyxa schiedti]
MKQGDTPLHIACRKGHIAVANLLLSHKDINLNLKNSKGETVVDVCELPVIRRALITKASTTTILPPQPQLELQAPQPEQKMTFSKPKRHQVQPPPSFQPESQPQPQPDFQPHTQPQPQLMNSQPSLNFTKVLSLLRAEFGDLCLNGDALTGGSFTNQSEDKEIETVVKTVKAHFQKVIYSQK